LSYQLGLYIFSANNFLIAATPGKVYINGQCIDCNKPDNDDGIIMPTDHKTAGSMSYTLTSGAVFFGIIYHLFS